MSEIEFQVHAAIFVLCAGSLLFVVAPLYAVRHVGAHKPPPLSQGLVPTEGFGLIDVAGVMLFLLLFSAGLATKGNEPELSAGALLMGFAFQLALIPFVVALVVWRLKISALWKLRWSRWYLVFLALPAVFVVWSFAAVLEVSGFNAWMSDLMGGDSTQESVKALEEETDVAVLVLLSLVAVIGAPLSEEVIFRGYIYPALKRLAGIPFSVIFSSALFAVVHFNLAALLPLFLLGVILALLYEATGSLWMPIAIHFIFNLATVVVVQLKRVRPEWFEKAGEAALIWLG